MPPRNHWRDKNVVVEIDDAAAWLHTCLKIFRNTAKTAAKVLSQLALGDATERTKQCRDLRSLTEDLVRLLSEMGHQPDWRVTLGLETQDGQIEQLQIQMTEHNRDLVRD
jgi:hypothetical protein